MRAMLLAAFCVLAPAARAQGADQGDAAGGIGKSQATDLAPVRVVGRRQPVDPFAFRNPVEAEATVFSRSWDEPPSMEEIGMRGGIVQIGINKGLELTAKGIRKLPGWQNQIVDAEARPPPLDQAQLERAIRLHEERAPPRTGQEPPR
ncbi:MULTISPECIES: hypothetical protein [unclassified Luteimonas]